MKICNGIVLGVICMCTALTLLAADVITKQQRHGSTLIVTYADGRIVTNSLFLAMAPEVKRELAKVEAQAMMQKKLSAVIADTREHIPETANLEDSAVAFLYLSQMKKDAESLKETASTNTLEHLIGAGMRQDLNKENENENE